MTHPRKGEGTHNSDHDLTRSWLMATQPSSVRRCKERTVTVLSMLLTRHPDITTVSSVITGNGEDGIGPSLPSGIAHLETSKAPSPLPSGSAAAPTALPAPGVGDGERDGVGEGPAVRKDVPGSDGGKTAALRPEDSKPNVGTNAESGGPAGDGAPMNSEMGEGEGRSGGPVAPPVEGPTSGAVFMGGEGEEGRMGGQQEEGLGGGVEGGGSGEVAMAHVVAGEDGKVRGSLGMAGSSAER